MAQIQQGSHVLDNADGAAPTRQLDELDRTDQERIYLPCMANLDHEAGMK